MRETFTQVLLGIQQTLRTRRLSTGQVLIEKPIGLTESIDALAAGVRNWPEVRLVERVSHVQNMARGSQCRT